MKIERHQVEAWVNELGKLEVEIPERDNLAFIENFLQQHPEQREHFAALAEEARELRQSAAALIGDIYSCFLTGSPSRGGLIVSLRAFTSLLEDDLA